MTPSVGPLEEGRSSSGVDEGEVILLEPSSDEDDDISESKRLFLIDAKRWKYIFQRISGLQASIPPETLASMKEHEILKLLFQHLGNQTFIKETVTIKRPRSSSKPQGSSVEDVIDLDTTTPPGENHHPPPNQESNHHPPIQDNRKQYRIRVLQTYIHQQIERESGGGESVDLEKSGRGHRPSGGGGRESGGVGRESGGVGRESGGGESDCGESGGESGGGCGRGFREEPIDLDYGLDVEIASLRGLPNEEGLSEWDFPFGTSLTPNEFPDDSGSSENSTNVLWSVVNCCVCKAKVSSFNESGSVAPCGHLVCLRCGKRPVSLLCQVCHQRFSYKSVHAVFL